MDPYFPIPIPAGPDPKIGVLSEKLSAAEKRIAELERRLNRLADVCETLREAMRTQGVGTNDDFVAIEEELAGRKQNSEVRLCRKCGKVLQHGIAQCIYCGSRHGEAL